MPIPATQARAQFTSDLVDVFSDMVQPTDFLRSFFPTEQSFVRYLSIQVERNYENVAVDVMRGTEGNRNTFSKSTEKQIDPPYYKEFFDLTSLDLYDRLFGSTQIDAGVYSQLIQTAARRLAQLKAKIERAYEKQCAEVLEFGTVTLVNATSINFGRKSASLVDKGSGAYWATGTVSPFADLENGCTFLRQTGKAVGDTFNAILGATALQDLYGNTIFKDRVKETMSNIIDTILPPQRNSVGATYHGTLSAGSYRVNLWSYLQSYDVSGTPSNYINAKKVSLIPLAPRFKLGYAAVPQLLKAGTGLAEDMEMGAPVAAPYVVGEVIDPNEEAHKIHVKSAGIAIPTAIDQMYTVQVVA